MPPSGRTKPAPTAPKKPDTDGDGLSDEEERRLGTNPRLKDTDFDGVMDKAELRLKTDPQDWDSDHDGQGDGLEIAIGRTDPSWYDRRFPVEVSDGERQPTPADPDGDRLDATKEQRFGTKADDPDSDGDGLGDWVELVSHSNPNRAYSQGANDKTTDLDDVESGLEAIRQEAIDNPGVEPGIYLPGGGRMIWGPAERQVDAALETPPEPVAYQSDFEADVETAPLDAAAADDMSFEYEA
ncbi:MAG: hypothetical protein ABWZ15_14275 [Acidimicrobiia bacterium]